MSAPEYHEAIFRWPHDEANEVIVTGEFDGWSASRHLARHGDGFQGTVNVPWNSRVHYKFVVDGHWTVVDGQPTEYDSSGNLNNVFDSPAKPPTPTGSETPTPLPEPTFIVPTLPSGQANGLLATVKEAAVAMVEAIAPGTTETPAATPMVEKVLEPVPQTEKVDEVIVEAEEITETAEGEVIVEEQEIKAEAVLPAPVEETPAAPVVPVPILPLNTAEEAKQLETTIVEGSTTSQPAAAAVEPSTHTPVTVPVANGQTPETKVVEGSATAESGAVEASTHVPAPPVDTALTLNGTTEASTHIPMPPLSPKDTPTANGTPAEPATDAPAAVAAEEPAPATNGNEEVKPAANGKEEAEPVANGKEEVKPAVNGKESKPETIALPLPTPSEVPLPPTPAANGNGKTTPPPSVSATSTPQTSPRKEKKHAFPSFGRHSRRSSSSVSVSTRGTVDEHGVLETPSRGGTTRKKRNSIFAKIKEIFTDHDHPHQQLNGEQKK